MVCGMVLLATVLAIHRKHAGATLGETGTVILEVKHDSVLAGRKRRLGLPSGSCSKSKKLYTEDWFALEQVEAVATHPATERIDHAFCTSRGISTSAVIE